jgi:spore coat polysaccharide biosynthesis protein SpsF
MRRVIIVQARMGSTRLPGKVMKEVAGRPMLAQQIKRLKQCTAADDLMIATTDLPPDDIIMELARKLDVGCFRGSEQDVLGRYVGAARQAQAEVVVRVTADCPLIDSEVIDRVIRELTDHAGECDYASNVIRRTYPQGLDVEAMFWDTLLRLDRLSRAPVDREHVTVLPRARPDLFLCRSIEDDRDNADLRWTVDTEIDLQVIRALFGALDLAKNPLPYRQVIAYVRAHPELAGLNKDERTWDPVPKVT